MHIIEYEKNFKKMHFIKYLILIVLGQISLSMAMLGLKQHLVASVDLLYFFVLITYIPVLLHKHFSMSKILSAQVQGLG